MNHDPIVELKRRSFLLGGVAAVSGVLNPATSLAAEQGSDPLPEFYDDYLQGIAGRVAAIRQRTKVTDSFFFITDPHIPANAKRSGRMIARLIRMTGINKVLCGGDLPCAFGDKAVIDATLKDYRAFWLDPIEAAGGIVYTAKGNHDFTIRKDWHVDEGWTYTSREARDFLMSWSGNQKGITNAKDPTACYFYVDFPEAKMRYIVADSQDTASERHESFWGVKYGIHETQAEWLASVAFATIPADWSAVVMHHIPCAPIVTPSAGERKVQLFLQQILDAYQNRKKLQLCGKEFDYTTARGRIVMDLTGHRHADRQTFCNGILYVTGACDAAYRDYKIGSTFCGTLPEKKRGTIYEQTFDIYQLTDDGTLYATRVGGGQDRIYHTVPRTVKKGEQMSFTTTLAGKIRWGCYDGDNCLQTDKEKTPEKRYTFFTKHATISSTEGILQAQEPGDVLVQALDEQFNKEIFCVRVIG
ncbi:MAG: metallophosphoesterase [Kiritimatiellae bacterium]|nr:metallophosphoesterase [Kiritimatiellia bacterium]